MSKRKGIGGHQSANAKTDDWITPPEIISALGPFDLDPCASVHQPWPTATMQYTKNDNGLLLPWPKDQRVWMNPPYTREEIPKWMRLAADQGFGTSLVFARTETEWFFESVWPTASSIMFLEGRLHFYGVYMVNGSPVVRRAAANSGAPSVLITYGKSDMERLGDSGLRGKHLLINYAPVIVVTHNATWKVCISMSIEKLGGSASVDAIYEMIYRVAPSKVRGNDNYKAKVRQQLQYYFTKIKRGQYSL